MNVIIRKAEIKDSSFIAKLTLQLGYETTVRETQKRLEKILSDKKHCVYVALADGSLTGWIHAFYCIHLESASFAEIGGLVVDEDFRSKGIGKNLIEKVEKWALKNKIIQLRVRSNIKRKKHINFI